MKTKIFKLNNLTTLQLKNKKIIKLRKNFKVEFHLKIMLANNLHY